ncbi:MAG: DUF2493 domain-containing protein, partial [Eubacterium sp.]|nr:DUF2493 domain-containing protein [Eubacterium sp.]
MAVKNKTKDNGTFKIIICGGRHFEDYDFLKINCDRVISELKPEKEIEIVSGHCKGCDLLGERYAEENGYKLTVFPADWAEYGKSAGIRRNIEMVEYIGIEPVGTTGEIDGAVIGFVSKNTRGTRFTLEEAQKKGIRTFVFEYTPGKKVIKELTKEEYDNIIDRVFLFAEMNRYYKKDENRLGPTGLAELVTGSPDLNTNEKYEIIKRIAGTVDGDI